MATVVLDTSEVPVEFLKELLEVMCDRFQATNCIEAASETAKYVASRYWVYRSRTRRLTRSRHYASLYEDAKREPIISIKALLEES